MGKKRKHPKIEDVLARPWCYYCERDFEDLKLLISHQKAKHFKCDRCGRRLNTAGGLSVHMNQVHKETLHQVENSLPNRQGLDVEIFGMEGIPHEIVEQHRNRIIQSFYQAQEDRRIATGNPLPGQAGQQPRKKIKMETREELLARVRAWRARKRAEREAANGAEGISVPASVSPAQYNGQYQPPHGTFEQQPGFPGQLPHGQPPVVYGHGASSLPPRPPASLGAPPGLPQRPAEGGPPDDVDRAARAAEEGEGDKKAKREKKGRMVYDDAETSPEERMAAMARYAFDAAAAA